MADEAPKQPAVPTDASTLEAPRVDPGRPTMAVKVYAPFKVYFEGDAYSISAVNATGPFDILPHHHNFLCMLVPCTITVQSLHGQENIKVNRALMHVKADRVAVFVDV